MRHALVLVTVAACGSSTTHHLADGALADSSPAHDAILADAHGHTDAAPIDGDVTATLDGLAWVLPCTSAHTATSCDTNATADASTTLAGVTGTTYDITVHLRGVVEQRTYPASCPDSADGNAVLGGTVSTGDTFNVYELEVSSPPQTIYVNAGTSGINNTVGLDYPLTFRADAGATVALHADSIDAGQIYNHDATGTPITVAGTHAIVQPYDGQFIEMDVDAVVPDPVATGATIGSGSAGFALSYAGAQQALVADAPSIEPTDVTLEAWFQATSVANDDSTVVGKAFSTGTGDSYVIWYQDQLHSGANVDSTAGATSLAFAPVDGLWHHVATTFDSAAARVTLYLDGAAVACVATAGPLAYDAHALVIGGDNDNGAPNGFWTGALDEVRLFSTVRTPDQIWADLHTHRLGPTAGLAGEWTFDEGTGQTAADSSGTGNTAVLGSTTAVEANDPAWVVSTAPH